jgi:ferric-dicitrate binding protein FerR (iron transport regulator)
MKKFNPLENESLPKGLTSPRPSVPEGYFNALQSRLEAIPQQFPVAAATPARRWRQGYKPWAAALAAAAALTAALIYLPTGTAALEPSTEELQQLYLDGDYSLSIQESTLLEVLSTDDFSELEITSTNLLEIDESYFHETYN